MEYCVNQGKVYWLFPQIYTHSTYNSFANLLIFAIDLLNVTGPYIFLKNNLKVSRGNEVKTSSLSTFFPIRSSFKQAIIVIYVCSLSICACHLHLYLFYMNCRIVYTRCIFFFSLNLVSVFIYFWNMFLQEIVVFLFSWSPSQLYSYIIFLIIYFLCTDDSYLCTDFPL